MKDIKNYLLSALVFLLFFTANIQAKNNNAHLVIEHWDTKNGAHVFFVKAPEIPMVDISVVFAAGSSYDNQYLGLASLVNSMLEEGTTTHHANEISSGFDSVGAEFSADIDQDMAEIKLRSLVDPKYFNKALSLFTEVLTQANFPIDALQRIKQQTLASIQLEQQSPSTVAAQAFFHAIYGDHPYGHATDGNLTTVPTFSRELVVNFYHQFYVAKNADIIMVGDLNLADAKAIAEKITKNLPEGSPAPKLTRASVNASPNYQFISFPSEQNTILLGQISIAPNDPDYLPLMLGNRILGGEPLSSILFNEVRNKRGLAYAVSSQFSPLKYDGPFYIGLKTRSGESKHAIDVVEAVLSHFIDKGPTLNELEAAKKNVMGSFPIKIASNSGILANVTQIAFYHLPLNFLNNYLEKVSVISVNDVTSAFKKHIQPQLMKTIVVGGNDPRAHVTTAK